MEQNGRDQLEIKVGDVYRDVGHCDYGKYPLASLFYMGVKFVILSFLKFTICVHLQIQSAQVWSTRISVARS